MERADYLNSIVSHDEYYSNIAQNCGIVFTSDMRKKIMRSEDVHLNDIPLSQWDSIAHPYKHIMSKKLKKRGDSWSLAGAVCIMKAAVKLLKA